MSRVSLLIFAFVVFGVASVAAAASPWSNAGELLEPLGISPQNNLDYMLTFDPIGLPDYSPKNKLNVADSECCDCVSTVAHHILDSAMKHVTDSCANVTCPWIKERCDWIADHPKEYSGYLSVQLRPFTDGYMYCYGNGTCDHPGMAKGDLNDALFMSDSSSNPALLTSQIAAAGPVLDRALKVKLDKAEVDKLREKENSGDEKDSRIAMFSKEETSSRPHGRHHHGSHKRGGDNSTQLGVQSCHKCLRHGVKYLLKKSAFELKFVCALTKCPHLQKFCEWAKDHKEEVRGMLYARVQPWKQATGFCTGNGSCWGLGGQPKESNETIANAPFTMGDKKEDGSAKNLLGRGTHDKMRRNKKH